METPRRPPASLRRWAIALAASLALNALLAAAIAGSGGGRSAPPARSTPIEFVLLPVPDAPGPMPSAREGASTAPPVAARRLATATSGPSGPVATTAVPDSGLPPGAAPTSPEASSDWPLSGVSPPGGAGAPARPDLSARPDAALVALYAPSDTSPQGRMERLLREDLGREKVRSGSADPYFFDLGRSMLAAWDPEPVVSARGFSGYLTNLGEGVVEAARVWAEQASRYGRTGNPLAPGETPLGLSDLAAVPEGISTRISDSMAVAASLAEQSRVRNAALVRVVQGADGRVLMIELVRSSASSAVDAQALRDLREASSRFPPPTPSALAGRPRISSLWEFALDVSISPPMPMLMVRFDEVLGSVDARLPLDRRLKKQVRLVAID